MPAICHDQRPVHPHVPPSTSSSARSVLYDSCPPSCTASDSVFMCFVVLCGCVYWNGNITEGKLLSYTDDVELNDQNLYET